MGGKNGEGREGFNKGEDAGRGAEIGNKPRKKDREKKEKEG